MLDSEDIWRAPLYNLSDETVKIEFKERIAVIDFVTTTPPTRFSIPYDWRGRSRVIFSEYHPDSLRSAIATQVVDRLNKSESTVESKVTAIRSQVEQVISTTLTVIVIMFAALALTITKPLEVHFWNSTVWLAAIGLWFSIRAYVLSKSMESQSVQQSLWRRSDIGVALLLGAMLLVFQYLSSHITEDVLIQAQDQAQKANQKVETLGARLETTNRDLQKLQLENSELQRKVLELDTKTKGKK
jgi:hypothetical protein